MTDNQFDEFAELLRGIGEVFDKRLSPAAIGIYWQALRQYDLAVVRHALSQHVLDSERGRWMPKPADVIAQMAAADGRPDADAAWTIGLASMDERATVVVNDEIMAGIAAAQDIYEAGDATGARMAFRSAYNRAVEDARAGCVPIRWWPSLGHDALGREQVLLEAVRKGLLPAPHVQALLPGIDVSTGQRLTAVTVERLIFTHPQEQAPCKP